MHLNIPAYSSIDSAFASVVEGLHYGRVPTVETESRNGPVLSVPSPVMLRFSCPKQRVLFNSYRDANPFFHLFEAVWMLAGSNQVQPLLAYNSRMADYSDDGVHLNGAYGHRWRHVSNTHDGGPSIPGIDQLFLLIKHLKNQPNSRRAVLQMWNATDDLLKIDDQYGQLSKDVCCNLSCRFRAFPTTARGSKYTLDMYVDNRSNDCLWGMLGANHVHFSFLHQFIAEATGMGMGNYYHCSTDAHVYLNEHWKPAEFLSWSIPLYYGGMVPKNWSQQFGNYAPLFFPWERELIKPQQVPLIGEGETSLDVTTEFWSLISKPQSLSSLCGFRPTTVFLSKVVLPMLVAFHWHKHRDYSAAFLSLSHVFQHSPDWAIAGAEWINRRRIAFEKRTGSK